MHNLIVHGISLSLSHSAHMHLPWRETGMSLKACSESINMPMHFQMPADRVTFIFAFCIINQEVMKKVAED